VVVGAGNGGLVSAATCAKAGLSVLLLEKHNLPGGCATSFRRGRFEFETSLHELCDVGPESDPGNVRLLMDRLGAQIQWLEVPDAFRVIVPGPEGYDATMPVGRKNFIDKMESYVPGSRESMEGFFQLADDTRRALDYISASSGKADPEVLKRDYANFLKTGAYSMNKVIRALKMPKKAQDILLTYWGYVGADGDTISFALYSRMLDLYLERSPYIAKDRSHELSLALEQRVRAFGGDIWYNTEVTRILTENGKVSGVEAGGRTIACKHVIANVIPHVVYAKMMDESVIPPAEIKKANAREFGSRGLVIYLGLNK
jgi:prolycopene isomerase